MPEEGQRPNATTEEQSATKPAKGKRGIKVLVAVLIVLVVLVVVVFVRESSVSARALEELRQAEQAAAAIEVPQIAPGENGADFYQRAFDGVVNERLTSELSDGLESGTLEIGSEKIAKLLADNKEPLALAMQGAAKPQCVFIADCSLGYSVQAPSLMKTRAVAQLLVLSAHRAAAEGRHKEAAARIAAILKMSRGMGGKQILLTHMIAVDVEETGLTAVREILTDGRGAPDFLTETARVLAEHEKDRPRIADSLLAEEICRRVGNARIVAFPGREESSAFAIHVRRWLGFPFREAEVCSGIWKQVRERAAKPYPQAYEELCALEADPETIAAIESLRFPYMLWLIPSSYGAGPDAEALAFLRAARAAVDLSVQKRKDGKYPDAAPALPVDPFSGKPLLYRKTAAGFVVYSVGGNSRKDDGGTNMYRDVLDPDVVFAVDPEARKASRARRKKRRPRPPRPPLPK